MNKSLFFNLAKKRLDHFFKRDFKICKGKAMQRNRGNNRVGKTRDLFKKIRHTKGTFHAEGHNKGQKCYGSNKSKRY